MKSVLTLLLAAAVIAGLIFAYREMHQEVEMEMQGEAPVIAPSRVERGADGSPVLKLDAATQNLLGLRTAVPLPGSVAREWPATARILDGTGLAAQVNELRSAMTALDAARADAGRKRKLFESGRNATASAVEQAEALALQHQFATESARDRVTAAWGGAITAHEDLPGFARRLLGRELALARVDLLASDPLPSAPIRVRLARPGAEESTEARVLGPAQVTEATLAGPSFLCLVESNAALLVPGSTMLARIDLGTSEQGTVLPGAAIVRHAGLGWIYAQISSNTFARRPAPLDRPHPGGWLARGEWTQPIVIAGVQSLLSEELKGGIQMKD